MSMVFRNFHPHNQSEDYTVKKPNLSDLILHADQTLCLCISDVILL